MSVFARFRLGASGVVRSHAHRSSSQHVGPYLREAFRRHRDAFTAPGTDDIVLVARRAILAAPWPAVVADLLKLARQAGLASSPGES